ncbi:MAG: FAD-binding protein [Armatimonadetes bacterium]|nr:FAD-binding protein [Armatimonadota bacterium]
MTTDLADNLRTFLPAGAVLEEPLQLALYAYDGTVYEGQPDLVTLPETTEQVMAIVRACNAAGVPIVPRGGGTSLSGGPVPVQGGVVVSFSRMDRVLELDYANQRAVVQPGVINQDLQNLVGQQGYFYAPDPASQSVCTLGGNVGENSGGPHCLKYGVTANHVLGVEMVLADGQVLRTGGKALDWPGYDLNGLIVGHEGTFGLVTEITCRLMPLPERVVTMLAIFGSLQAASQTVSDIIAAGIIPATLEMMDNPMIRAVEQALQAGYPLDAGAVLIIELDGMAAGLQDQVARVRSIGEANGVTEFRQACDEAERALLWKGRKGAFGAVVNIAPSKICTDISVPRTKLPETLAAVMDIGRRHGVPIANVFHAGDGNLHPLVLYDPRDPDIAAKVEAVDAEITQLALQQGGVLTGEHGIGCCKRKHMTRMFGPAELRAMRRVREAFDAKGRLNPGKVLPDDLTSDPPPWDEEGKKPRGNGPSAATVAVCERLAAAYTEGRKAVLRGQGTKSSPPPEGAEVVDLAALDRIVSFDHENLTVTVEAGLGFAALDAVLAERGQMLALRPRFRAQATIGGTLAAGESGPCRLLYGGPRDLVTGLQAVLADGTMVSFGSTCVKNVAGYALEKLLVGSRGTLAAIVEVTLRTLPRPQTMRTLALHLEAPSGAEDLLAALIASPLRPAAVELVHGMPIGATADAAWTLLVGLEGFAAEVQAMADHLARMARDHHLPPWQAVDGDYLGLWDRVTDLAPGPVLKASCPLSATAKLAHELSGLAEGLVLRAGPGLGLLHLALPPATDVAAFQHGAQMVAEHHGGTTSWLLPVPERSVTRLPDTTRDVVLRLKSALDPESVLPPPRF